MPSTGKSMNSSLGTFSPSCKKSQRSVWLLRKRIPPSSARKPASSPIGNQVSSRPPMRGLDSKILTDGGAALARFASSRIRQAV